MNRCRLCVIPDTRPDTAFVDGVCSACIAYAKRPTFDAKAGHEQLLEVLARAKETARLRGNHYDVIVPSSGGKDSTYQVLTLLKLGARPLVITATTCHLTPIGRKNLDNLSRWATTIEVTPRLEVRAKLNRLGLTMVGDISWPEHVSIFTLPFRVAQRAGIPFLFYGENPQNQYGGPLDSQGARQMTRRWVSEFGGFLGLRPQDLVGVDGLTESELDDYQLPSAESLQFVEAHFLGQYIPWDSHRNARIARAAGFTEPAEPPCQANYWTHENLDNAQTGLHDYGMYLKYGFGRGAAQISVDVRAGLIDRDSALRWVDRHDGAFPEIYAGVPIDAVIERLGMDRLSLMQALDKFTNHDIGKVVACAHDFQMVEAPKAYPWMSEMVHFRCTKCDEALPT